MARNWASIERVHRTFWLWY